MKTVSVSRAYGITNHFHDHYRPHTEIYIFLSELQHFLLIVTRAMEHMEEARKFQLAGHLNNLQTNFGVLLEENERWKKKFR